MRKFILGLDEGTTNLRSVLYDVDKHNIVDIEAKNFKQFYPRPAWVEQDANEIYNKILQVSKAVLKRNNVSKEELLGIGITNQRETVVAWDRRTGKPVYNAIVWQCRRTTNAIKNLSQKAKQTIKEKTGLIANPYFSASKMKWILDNVKEARTLAKEHNLCFGTIDSYLAFRLTGNFVTDTTNASRTMLMNIHTLEWDDELLSIFKIPKDSLPKILPCDSNFGNVKKLFGAPICSIIGDQQSSMIGQGTIYCGNTKVTFGTGGFILTNIGNDSHKNFPNLLTTVASSLGKKTTYAVEGSIYSACSAIEWLKNIQAYDDVNETAKMAMSLKNNEGVYFVPAFTGLGAPYWNNEARACIVGMSFSSKKEHIVRACLESMAYNTKAIVDEMKKTGLRFKTISVDGGASKNEFVLQFLSDMLNHEIVKSKFSESTVLGTIYVAMLSLKLIKLDDIKKLTESNKRFLPKMTESERKRNYEGWERVIRKL
ncbi:MAG: glycerol kinase [Candidatus Caccovivens sp.]